MTIIDIHGHIGSWFNFLVPEPSAEWLVDVNASTGVAATGVSHLVAFGHDTRAGNRMTLAAVRKHQGRLGAWIVANPHTPKDVELVAEQLREPYVWGLKLHPDVHEYAITDPGYAPYLELARREGVPVLSHGQTRSNWSEPAQLAEVAARYPGLTLLMGHSGLWADGFERAATFAVENPGLYLEICGSRLTSQWLERIVAIAGVEKVLFGTDASFLDPRVGLGKVLYSRLSDEDRQLVLGGNALRLLGSRFTEAGR